MSTVAWWGYGIAVVALLLILGGMFALIRVMSDDSERYEELRTMMDPLFHTPSFLRPGTDAASTPAAPDETAASRSELEPFEDECPGCRHTVTQVDTECPSCGLRLLN